MAYGDSQARGQIGAVAAGLRHRQSNTKSELVCDLHHSSQQHQILNPLSKARDQTCNLIVPSRICFHCATMGTPRLPKFSLHMFTPNYNWRFMECIYPGLPFLSDYKPHESRDHSSLVYPPLLHTIFYNGCTNLHSS